MTAHSLSLARWGAVAAAVGGGLWVAKGAGVLLTGDQPEYTFEVAPLFFALGLVGLHARLQGRGGRPAHLGGTLAWAGVALAAMSGAHYVATSADSTLRSATIALTMLSIFGSLVLLGIAVRRVGALPRPWRSLPLAIGVGAFPLIMVGGMLEALGERLLEVPIVVIGFTWMALGYAISSHRPARDAPTRASA